jgi:negative regulator of flagellin synthesis FlgM
MSDAISNFGRMSQTNPSLRNALEKADKKGGAKSPAGPEAPPAAKTASSDVRLSNVASKAMAEPGFDRAKVESIKQALQDGQYAINPRRIAESFVALERMIDR